MGDGEGGTVVVVVVLVVVLLSGVGLTVVEVVVGAGVVVVVLVVVLSAAFVDVVDSVVLVVVDGVVVLASGAIVDESGITGVTLEPSCSSLVWTSKQEAATTANASTTFRNCEGDISPNRLYLLVVRLHYRREEIDRIGSWLNPDKYKASTREREPYEIQNVDRSMIRDFSYSKARKLEMERN